MKKQADNKKDTLLGTVGELLQKRRIQLGLSQEELAYKADMNRAFLSDIERGKRNLSLYMFKKICDAMDTTMADIVKNVK